MLDYSKKLKPSVRIVRLLLDFSNLSDAEEHEFIRAMNFYIFSSPSRRHLMKVDWINAGQTDANAPRCASHKVSVLSAGSIKSKG